MPVGNLLIAICWGAVILCTCVSAIAHIVYLEWEYRWISMLRREQLDGKLLAAARTVRLSVGLRLVWLVGMVIAETDGLSNALFAIGTVQPTNVRALLYTTIAFLILEVWVVGEDKTRDNSKWWI